MYPSSGYNLNNSTLPESEQASRNQDGAIPAPAALRPNPPRELRNKLQPVFKDLGFCILPSVTTRSNRSWDVKLVFVSSGNKNVFNAINMARD